LQQVVKCELDVEVQQKQCGAVAKAMLKSIKKYCPDFVFPGKFADPEASVLEKTKHIKASNDDSEHDAGILHYQALKSRKQTTERTEAKMIIRQSGVLEYLLSLPEKEAERIWASATILAKTQRKVDLERRTETERERQENVEQKAGKGKRRAKKKAAKQAKLKGVKIARTLKELDDLCEGLYLKPLIGKAVLYTQMEALQEFHGWTTHDLPKSNDGNYLGFWQLYANLVTVLREGDPTIPETRIRLRKKQASGAGHPVTASEAERQAKKRKLEE
jgi:hypothetical protein